MTGTSRTLILSDGGLSALLACVAARESALAIVHPSGVAESTPKPIVVPSSAGPGSALARREAIVRQCEALDLELADIPGHDHIASAAQTETLDLVRAGYTAIERGCSLVIWPVQFRHEREIDLQAVSDAVDRALLIGRVLTIDNDGSPLRIDVPYADLTDRQIADLVVDMDAPAGLCWWWHAQLADPSVSDSREEFASEHRRWSNVLSAVGWHPAP